MASLVDFLLQKQFVTQEQLDEAHSKQKEMNRPVEQVLVDLEFVTDVALTKLCAMIFKMPIVVLEDSMVDKDIVSLVPEELCLRYSVFPIRKEEEFLLLAMGNPRDIIAIDDIREIVGEMVKPVLCSRDEIYSFIAKYSHIQKSLAKFTENIVTEANQEDGDEKVVDDSEMVAGIDIEFSGGEHVNIEEGGQESEGETSPTVKLINMILADAIKEKASDIHLEPREGLLEVRYRVDGDLRNIMKVPKKVQAKMVARIKILANLDITQDVKPQDGRINLVVNGRKVDFRISTIPTYYGEKIVARILDATEAKTELQFIGLEKYDYESLCEAVRQPQGMVLVTGPTGSGKTSSLYAALNFIKGETTNIVTIEDPVEFVNEGINQIQVNPSRGVTFASGLRSILRQDPNVILIGEIRDQETAEIAMKASITGHLVLSTLHTNNCIATISRLADMGIDHYMISSAVIMIVSQRLIKVICPECKEEFTPDEEFKSEYSTYIKKYNLTKFYKGSGCENCNFTGYRGRTAVFEVLQMTGKMKDLIANGAGSDVLRVEAMKGDIKMLVDAGVEKVRSGLSTLEQVSQHLGAVEKEGGEEPSVNVLEKKKVVTDSDQEEAVADEVLDLKKSLQKDIEADVKEDIADVKEDIREDIREDIKEDVKEEMEPVVENVLEEGLAFEEKEELPVTQDPVKKVEEGSLETVFSSEDAEKKVQPSVEFVEVEAPAIAPNQNDESNEEIAVNESVATEDSLKQRVLIAEDEKGIQKVLVKVLETAGFNVIKADNGKEALVQTCKVKPDIIITDAMMPEMDGFELIKVLRSRLETAVVPILMLTALQDKESEHDAKHAGADEYLRKPVDSKALVKKVREMLEAGSLRDGKL